MTSIGQSPRLPQGFLGFALLTALSVFASSAITVALPAVASDFDAGEATTGWVLAAFMLAFPIGSALFGRMVDSRGQRTTFRIGMSFFIGGSVFGAAAGGVQVLIFARLLQGLGCGVIPVLSIDKITEGVDAATRLRAIAAMAAVVSICSAVSSLVGGALTIGFGWRAVLVLPVAAAVVVPFVDATMNRETQQEGILDLRGAILVSGAISAGLLLLQSSSLGLSFTYSGALAVGGGLCVGMGIWNMKRRPLGFLPKALITDPDTVRPSLAAMCLLAAYLGCALLVPVMLTRSVGWSALQIGAAMVPGASLGVLATRVIPRIIGLRGARTAALVVVLSSGAGVALMTLDPSSVLLPLVGAGMASGGTMGGQVVFTEAAVRQEGDPLRGSSVGFFHLALFSGAALGAVVAGSVGQAAGLRMASAALLAFPVAAAFLGIGAVTERAPGNESVPASSAHSDPPRIHR